MKVNVEKNDNQKTMLSKLFDILFGLSNKKDVKNEIESLKNDLGIYDDLKEDMSNIKTVDDIDNIPENIYKAIVGTIKPINTNLSTIDPKLMNQKVVKEFDSSLRSLEYRSRDKNVNFGVTYAPKFLFTLYGPPGTGKTAIVNSYAVTINNFFASNNMNMTLSFFDTPISVLKGKYYGESDKSVDALFKIAKNKAPSLIFIDEIDGLIQSRDKDSISPIQSFLTSISKIDNYNKEQLKEDNPKPIFFCAATNYPSMLDKALLRRLDLIKVGLPSEELLSSVIINDLNKSKQMLAFSDIDSVGKTLGSIAFKKHFNFSDLSSVYKNISNKYLSNNYIDKRNKNIPNVVTADTTTVNKFEGVISKWTKDDLIEGFQNHVSSTNMDLVNQIEAFRETD